ncbi:MAG: hypothetical protein K0S27_1073 [Gammaproteobacteria bacterium]|nr:hypothetical protein [Gammaproteobacteria bacterium]
MPMASGRRTDFFTEKQDGSILEPDLRQLDESHKRNIRVAVLNLDPDRGRRLINQLWARCQAWIQLRKSQKITLEISSMEAHQRILEQDSFFTAPKLILLKFYNTLFESDPQMLSTFCACDVRKEHARPDAAIQRYQEEQLHFARLQAEVIQLKEINAELLKMAEEPGASASVSEIRDHISRPQDQDQDEVHAERSYIQTQLSHEIKRMEKKYLLHPSSTFNPIAAERKSIAESRIETLRHFHTLLSDPAQPYYFRGHPEIRKNLVKLQEVMLSTGMTFESNLSTEGFFGGKYKYRTVTGQREIQKWIDYLDERYPQTKTHSRAASISPRKLS